MMINNKPLVSVVIATYNRANIVIKSLNSVFAQSFKDYEIIVIDDGSTDNTKEILKQYKNKINYIYQENKGVSSARNRGINVSLGKWIAILDSDDEWEPDYLEFLINSTKFHSDAIVHIVNSNTILLNGIKQNHFNNIGIKKIFKNKDFIKIVNPFYNILKHRPWFIQAALIKKKYFIKAGMFNPKITIGEDFDILAKIATMGPFIFYNKDLVKIFRRDEEIDNLSSQVKNEGVYTRQSFEYVLNFLLKNYQLNLLEKLIVKKTLSSNYRGMGNIYFINNDFNNARKYYRKGFIINPSFVSFLKLLFSFFPKNLSRKFIKINYNIKLGTKEFNNNN